MAMKKRQVAKTPEGNDNTINKAAYGLGIFIILLLAVSRLVPYYERNGYLFEIRDALGILQYVFAGLGLVCFALWFVLQKKKSKWSTLSLAFSALFLLSAFTAYFLFTTWVSYVTMLYIGYVVLLAIFLVYLLYPIEFFLITIAVVMSGVAFYTMRNGATSMLNLGLVFFFLLLCGLLAYMGGKSKGKVLKKQIFSPNFNPTNLYLNSALWIVCLVLALVLGPVFAYYCLFAAGAVWLIFAVYYTVKLS